MRKIITIALLLLVAVIGAYCQYSTMQISIFDRDVKIEIPKGFAKSEAREDLESFSFCLRNSGTGEYIGFNEYQASDDPDDEFMYIYYTDSLAGFQKSFTLIDPDVKFDDVMSSVFTANEEYAEGADVVVLYSAYKNFLFTLVYSIPHSPSGREQGLRALKGMVASLKAALPN